MKKVFAICMFTLVGISLFASQFTIIAKGRDGMTPAKGTIELNTLDEIYTSVKINISEIVYKEFSGGCSKILVDEYTVKYTFDKGYSILVSQDANLQDIYYFEVPNFFEGQSGTIVYKTQYPSKQGGSFGNPVISGNTRNNVNVPSRAIKYFPKPSSNFGQEGIVVVNVVVDKNGHVTSAKVGAGTTIADENTISLALNAAKSAIFTPGDSSQTGTIKYKF